MGEFNHSKAMGLVSHWPKPSVKCPGRTPHAPGGYEKNVDISYHYKKVKYLESIIPFAVICKID